MKTDILCVGEVLIDFIGNQDGNILQTKDYHRYLGGSPTNVAMNTARLGLHVKLVATMGNDGFGDYMIEKLETNNVDISLCRRMEDVPTSVIFVSRTTETPEFIAYREADHHILPTQIPDEVLEKTTIFHTTCFALSKKQARQTILEKVERAVAFGVKPSIDLNYSPKIWADRKKALETIKAYCSYNPLVKISEDDTERIFGKILEAEMFDFFHQNNVDLVCLTKGSKGVVLSQKGKDIMIMPAMKIETVRDATGAGDAFWSGFLYAYIQKQPYEKCLETALKLAALKLQNVGRLPENIDIITQLL